MAKLDLAREYKSYYKAGKKPELAEFAAAGYLAIEGCGAPAGARFVKSVEALYPLAYGIKKVCKIEGNDFAVPKLEGLWWVEGDVPALDVPRSEWSWKLLIRMPYFVSEDTVKSVQPEVAQKKRNDLIGTIRFDRISEGKSAQILHMGPYADEPETISILMKFIEDNGLSVNGLHHEIYLSDPRKTAPEKMKTLIRYPVA